jgi:hypothetical protein
MIVRCMRISAVLWRIAPQYRTCGLPGMRVARKPAFGPSGPLIARIAIAVSFRRRDGVDWLPDFRLVAVNLNH